MMPLLINIRHTTDAGIAVVCADFRAGDSRLGSVCVPKADFEAHGEIVLQQQADACARQALAHGYKPPVHDRWDELR